MSCFLQVEFIAYTMKTLLIQLPECQNCFSWCYSIAFLLVLAILLYEGYKRHFPLLPWILILVFARISFIIGSKLFSFSTDEWRYMASHSLLFYTSKKFLFGGLFLGGIALLIGKRLMRFNFRFLDAFALAIPAAIAVQRVGCFFAGCCYGKPSDLPFAVQYPVNTPAHYHQYMSGMIGDGNLFSSPVHPVQLYECIGAIAIFILILFLRKKWKSEGSSFICSLTLYLVLRFVVEFFRDPLAHVAGGGFIAGFNLIQIGILPFIPLLIILLYHKEHKPSRQVEPRSYRYPSDVSMLVFFVLSGCLIRIFAKWFTPIELFAILASFIVATLFTIVYIYKNFKTIRHPILYAAFLVLPFILMSQAMPDTNRGDKIRTSTSVGLGVYSGNYTNQQTYQQGEGCDAVYTSSYFRQKYTIGGASVNYKIENLTRFRETNMGVNVYAGNHSEQNLTKDLAPDNLFIMGINPYVKYDNRWLGIGGGLHLGELDYLANDAISANINDASTGRRKISAYPQIYFRIGPRDILFLDFHLADQFPTPFPGLTEQFGLGTGFGLKNGTNLRVGGSILGSTYIALYLPIENKVIVEPLFCWGKSEGLYHNAQFSLGIRYVIGEKTSYKTDNKNTFR